MKTFGRLVFTLMCTVLGLVVGFLVGFYASLFLGAHLFGVLPGSFGLAGALIGGILTFRAVWKGTSNFAVNKSVIDKNN
jgi:hypothetical protein